VSAHEPSCSSLSGGSCDCIVLEEAMIERASRPSPADLIRKAKAKGLITGVYNYAQAAQP
jgi:hypothetical protein